MLSWHAHYTTGTGSLSTLFFPGLYLGRAFICSWRPLSWPLFEAFIWVQVFTWGNMVIVTQPSTPLKTKKRWGECRNLKLIHETNINGIFPSFSMWFSTVWGLAGALFSINFFFCNGLLAPNWRISTTKCLFPWTKNMCKHTLNSIFFCWSGILEIRLKLALPFLWKLDLCLIEHLDRARNTCDWTWVFADVSKSRYLRTAHLNHEAPFRQDLLL